MNTINLSSKLVGRYGNVFSGMMAQTRFKADAKVGDEATVLHGRDRNPAKIVEIKYTQAGRVKAFVLQEFEWTKEEGMTGNAKEILWDKPSRTPKEFKVVLRGRLAGTVKDALIGHADPYYDFSF